MDKIALGKTKLKQAFIGRLFGKMALKSMIKNEKPLQRYIGALTELMVNNGLFRLMNMVN